MKDTKNMPALVLLGIGLVAFVCALAAHATSNHTVGLVLGAISAVVLLASGAWFLIEHRRVRSLEERWHAEHPDTQVQRPSA